jgi:hypothetical protein
MGFFTRCEEKYFYGLLNVLNACSGYLGEGRCTRLAACNQVRL